MVGTAGAIDPRLEASVYDVGAAIQHDVTDIDGIVGQHVSLPTRVEFGREGVTIATGDHFVDDAEAVSVSSGRSVRASSTWRPTPTCGSPSGSACRSAC